ncbi:MAG: hypothetical protein ACLP9L_11005 [Thermoguttaceae bacterium]
MAASSAAFVPMGITKMRRRSISGKSAR